VQRIFRTFLFWTLMLCACSAGVPASPVLSSTTEAPLPLPTTAIPDSNPEGQVTTIPPSSQNCGYQWAQQDLPELSSSFQQSVQALLPEAQANAFAFGENCVLADGSIAGFSAMETDFNITLRVGDLTSESDLGEWIVKVMQVIESIPPEQIVGPRPGRVSFTFQAGGDQMVVNFYVDRYQSLPSGLSNREIFQALQAPQ
jgi:hypothetical protein